GFPGEHNFELLKAFVALVKRGGEDRVVLEVYRNCGEALGMPDEDEPVIGQRISRFYDALRRAGREMVAEGRVSQETVEQVHMKLMTDEEYMAGANKHWDRALEETG
ncbi:MAG: flavodoxin family protein, partial [Dehalococcoidia bacterium]|nr:flavodoxin family protein [Dehalococcoidia bacterium]